MEPIGDLRGTKLMSSVLMRGGHACICHAFTGGREGSEDDSGIAGARGREDDGNLYACGKGRGGEGRAESVGWDA
jgi:hypothetical protein